MQNKKSYVVEKEKQLLQRDIKQPLGDSSTSFGINHATGKTAPTSD